MIPPQTLSQQFWKFSEQAKVDHFRYSFRRVDWTAWNATKFSGKTNNFDFFDTNLPKNGFWVRNFENLSRDSESTTPSYHVYLFSGKTGNFDLFSPNLPKNGFWCWYFEYLSPDSESTPPRYHVCQYSGKTDNFVFFGPNFFLSFFIYLIHYLQSIKRIVLRLI